jgi:fructokinase
MFLVCGEALFDIFATAPSHAGLSLEGRVGGSPFNVALGLARLGRPVGYFGALSRDIFGEHLLDALRGEGVRTESTLRTDAPTTLSIVGVDERGVPSYTFHGERGADRDVPHAALEAVPADGRALHFGSYSMVVEPVGTTLRALVEREYQRRLIAYDPNVRLNVVPSIDRWREVMRWMARRAHLLKASEEDVGLLYPGVALQALVHAWLDEGVKLAVITRGAAGAVAWTANAHARCAAHPVAVVDTVGAGDAFQAATLAWLAEHDALEPTVLRALTAPALESMLHFASLAAAHTCSLQGAQLPPRADLELS